MKDQNSIKKSIKTTYKRKRKKDFRIIDFVALIFLVFFAVLAGISVKNYIEYKVLDFAQSVNGTLMNGIPVKALIIREETLVKAPQDGNFITALDEGIRVKEGAVIGFIESYNNDVYKKYEVLAPKSGTVHYDLDGLEGMLCSESLKALDLDELFSSITSLLKPKNIDDNTSELNTGKGHTVAKIIDNLINYAVILEYDGDVFFPDQSYISFLQPDTKEYLRGDILDSMISENHKYLLLDVNSDSDYLTENRYFVTEAITKEFSGIIIPLSAITENNSGEKGVYQKYLGNLIFYPVKVIGIIGEEAVVKGINSNKEIVINPEKAREGQIVY